MVMGVLLLVRGVGDISGDGVRGGWVGGSEGGAGLGAWELGVAEWDWVERF